MSERQVPFYCPYCSDEDLRPEPTPPGAWRCTTCLRVFVVKFAGLADPVGPAGSTAAEVAR